MGGKKLEGRKKIRHGGMEEGREKERREGEKNLKSCFEINCIQRKGGSKLGARKKIRDGGMEEGREELRKKGRKEGKKGREILSVELFRYKLYSALEEKLMNYIKFDLVSFAKSCRTRSPLWAPGRT